MTKSVDPTDNSAKSSNPVITQQIHQLRLATTRLKQAYNGTDVESIETGKCRKNLLWHRLTKEVPLSALHEPAETNLEDPQSSQKVTKTMLRLSSLLV